MSATQRIVLLAATLVAAFLVGAGCQQEPVVGPSVPAPTPTATPPPVANAGADALEESDNTAESPPPPSLRVWISDEFAQTMGSDVGQVDNALAGLFESYTATYPDVALTVEPKSANGPGGILEYLRHGRDVAPTIMPDVVLLPAEKSAAAAGEQLIYPFNGELQAAVETDLFPAAQSLATIEDSVVAYPVTLGSMPIAVFNRDVFSRTLPVTWEEMAQVESLKLGLNLSTRGADLVTALYLSQGAPIQDETGQLMWDEAALTEALSQLELARRSGVLDDATLSASSAENVWRLFEEGTVNAVITTADDLLLHYDDLDNLRVAPVPGIDGPITPLVRAWNWSVTTPDPERQTLSAEFIAHVTQPELLRPFTVGLPAPPASRTVLDQWPGDNILNNFLDTELRAAQPFPPIIDDQTADVLQQAVSRILIVGESTETAVQRIIGAQ